MLDKTIDSVAWPTLSEDNTGWASNPDINGIRRPRGSALSFAMSWHGCQHRTSQRDKERYLEMLKVLLNVYDAGGFPVEQTALRAALDSKNLLGLKELLNFPFKLQHNGLNLRQPIFYIYSRHGSASKTCYNFSPVQYALIMNCDESLLDLLVSRGASNDRVLYSTDSKHKRVVEGTKLRFEIGKYVDEIPIRKINS
jgi:hypothetical protein